jgi:hypothetical protein
MVYHSIAIEVKFLQCTESIVKDRGGDRRGGGEWKPNKILSQESDLCPTFKTSSKNT